MERRAVFRVEMRLGEGFGVLQQVVLDQIGGEVTDAVAPYSGPEADERAVAYLQGGCLRLASSGAESSTGCS